jgi:hypothetical protein
MELKGKYNIYAFSYWCVFTQMIIGILLPIIITTNSPDFGIVYFIGFFLISNILAWYISRRFLLKPIVVEIIGNVLKITYLKQITFKVKKSGDIKFSNISRFSDFSDRDLKFKIYVENGATLTLYKSHFWSKKDDFESLIDDFKLAISNYNNNIENTYKSSSDNLKKIKYGDDTYLVISVIFFIFAFICVVVFIDSIKTETFEFKKLFGLVVLIILGLIFLYRHKQSTKKD